MKTIDLILAAFNRHPGSFVVVMALGAVLLALSIVRQATPADVSAATVLIRGDIAALSSHAGKTDAAVAAVEEVQADTLARLAKVENALSTRTRTGGRSVSVTTLRADSVARDAPRARARASPDG